MGYIIVLCLSGGVMESIYFFLKYMLGERIPADWQYRMMKGVILFYLIPLPFLKRIYKAVIGCFLKPPVEGMMHLYHDKSLIVNYGGKLIFNQTFEGKCAALGVWLLVAMGIFAYQYIRYLRNAMRLNKCGKQFADEDDICQIERLRRRYGIKRKVRFMGSRTDCPAGEAVFTTGILRPMIVCFSKMQGRERNMVLEHEMVHIKRWDILWRLFLTAAQIIHFYNPLVWCLSGEFERVCEMSCDDRVLQGKEEKEKREYGEMLLAMVMSEQEDRAYSLGLSRAGKQLKERIDNVMKEKKKCFGKLTLASIFGVAIFLNSLTVFAYEDVQYERIKEGNEKHLEGVLNGDVAFVPGGEEEIKEYPLFENAIIETSVVYEMQFEDEEGNIYPIYTDKMSTYVSCSHNYVSGIYQKHIKSSNGGCSLIQYNAKRCTKCTDLLIGNEIARITYQECPH